ncbi:MAG TPA: biopolymer transporter ExbD [Balneolaceae bacterium]|nr:biopolymer transporter ExbD [Balneolaceae bacterium]
MSVHFKKSSSGTKQEVPTSAMPDIVFILLIFFMVTTVLKKIKLKVHINYPKAKNIEKIEQKRLISYIYVGPRRLGAGKYGKTQIQIDNAIVDMNDISSIESNKLNQQPKLIVSIRMDKNTHTGVLIDIQKQLQDAGALRINYSSKPENSGGSSSSSM